MNVLDDPTTAEQRHAFRHAAELILANYREDNTTCDELLDTAPPDLLLALLNFATGAITDAQPDPERFLHAFIAGHNHREDAR